MFRRSRFSIRPNVGTAGRAAAAPQEAPSTTQEASETPKDVSESSTPTAVTETKTAETPSEKPPASGDGNEQNGEGTSSSAAVQRRKRFSVKPKVAPGRPSAVARTPKSPVKAVSETPVEAPGSDLEKTTTSSQTGTAAAPQGLQSPKRRRASGESKQPRVQPPTSPISSDSPGLCADLVDEDLAEPTNLPTDNKESVELSEKAKTLVSSKSALSMSPSAFSLSRLLNDPSDLQRLAKAQKLRELLRQERDKERRLKQAKAPPREFTLDPTKMTMRDLIRYLPQSNPMSSSLDQSVQDETVVPPSPEREESPETAQEPEAEVLPKVMSPREEEEGVAAAAAAAEEEEEEDEEEESLMVPQVKVAEDGTLIIDEASLTVEVQRANKPNPAQDRDPIFERGSTTTYSSFRKGTHSKPWSSEETDMFFLAISMVGTDFSMICQLFPHRARSEIKNKFKKEERGNSWRIDKAFKGEKENEDLCNEGASPVSKPKRQRKRKTKKAVVEEEEEEEPKEKKKKSDKQSSEQGEVCMPEDTEAALPEDHTSSDINEKTENVKTSKDTAIKPAKLSRGRAPKPLLPLGRKWGKKAAPASTQAKGAAADEEDESASVEESTDSSPSNKANNKKSADDSDNSSEEEMPPSNLQNLPGSKYFMYGRVPKRTNLLKYPGKEGAHSSATDSTPTPPAGSTAPAAKPKPRCSAKRGRSSEQKSANKSKKPKLVTLRASQSESSDEEDGKQWDHEETEEQPACSSNKDSTAPAFVPVCVRSPQPMLSELEETMEELDILANMPDVLGISQDSLCPDASCDRVQNDTGTPEPCEHQLDLLVDVIDFLSSEHTGEDESYNEAAQTLLTIGNLTHLSQSAQSQTATQDHTTGTQHPEEGPAPKPAEQEENTDALVSGDDIKETPATDAAVESQSSTTDRDKMSHKDWLEAGPSSQGNWEVDISPSITVESNTQPLDVPDVHSSKDSSADSEVSPVLSTDASSIPDPEESSLQPCSQSDSSQDAAEQRSETREMTQTSNDKSQSSTHETELPDSPNSSKKAPPTRRGRLIKPKPNLGRGSRPPQPHQVQSTAQAEADFAGRSEDVDASVSHSPVPEVQCDVQEPAEGAVEPHSSQEASANDSGSLLGCLTEIIEQLSQSESPTNDAGSSVDSVTQGQDSSSQLLSSLSVLSEQVTSEPDEPFFILSLTEIPVCSSGREVDSAAEPLPYLPLADASIQQHSSVPGESSATVGEEGSLSTVPVSDITAYIDSITEDPVDPHGRSTTTVQPPTSPENVEKLKRLKFPQSRDQQGLEEELWPFDRAVTRKAASRDSKVKTPRTTRKRSSAPPTPVASTSHNATSTPSRTQLPDDGPTTAPTASSALTEVDVELTTEHHHQLFSESTSSSSQCTSTEVSLCQQSECVEEEVEEPTSVSHQREGLVGLLAALHLLTTQRAEQTWETLQRINMNDNIQDKELLKQIEREVRMREGASKLLAACSQRDQALEASKSLQTCNARILALLSQLQRMRKAQILQRVGRRSDGVDLRIPLMWKDSEYFKNKGELHRCAVFCLLRCGTQIYDTDLVMVDRTLTDICFEDTIVFSEDPEERASLGPLWDAPLGRGSVLSLGRQLCVAPVEEEGGNMSPPLNPDLSTLGPKFHLLAHTTLTIEHVQEAFKTHDLLLSATEDSPFWLPLFGNMCCRLVAQPQCMTQPAIAGQLKVKLGEDLNCPRNVFGVLRGQSLLCYQSQEDLESEDEPLLVVSIRKDTLVCAFERDAAHSQSIYISTQGQEQAETCTLTTRLPEETQRWSQALWRHVFNILTPSSPWEGLVVPDLSGEIRMLLSSYYKESSSSSGLATRYTPVVIDDPDNVAMEKDELEIIFFSFITSSVVSCSTAPALEFNMNVGECPGSDLPLTPLDVSLPWDLAGAKSCCSMMGLEEDLFRLPPEGKDLLLLLLMLKWFWLMLWWTLLVWGVAVGIVKSVFGELLGFCAVAAVPSSALGETCMGLFEDAVGLTSITYALLDLAGYEYSETPASASTSSSVSHPLLLAPSGQRAVYRGEGLFKNFGVLLDEGGAKDETGDLLEKLDSGAGVCREGIRGEGSWVDASIGGEEMGTYWGRTLWLEGQDGSYYLITLAIREQAVTLCPPTGVLLSVLPRDAVTSFAAARLTVSPSLPLIRFGFWSSCPSCSPACKSREDARPQVPGRVDGVPRVEAH
ncbi:hypothetical protein INR49_030722 [Caranx melampygus]|nr:hypothetical protein INR49_030722 [Caranx melampygus]